MCDAAFPSRGRAPWVYVTAGVVGRQCVRLRQAVSFQRRRVRRAPVVHAFVVASTCACPDDVFTPVEDASLEDAAGPTRPSDDASPPSCPDASLRSLLAPPGRGSVAVSTRAVSSAPDVRTELNSLVSSDLFTKSCRKVWSMAVPSRTALTALPPPKTRRGVMIVCCIGPTNIGILAKLQRRSPSEQLDAFLTFMRATSAYITHTPPVKSTFDISYFTIPYDFQSSVVLNGFSIFSLSSFQTFAERKEKRAIHSGAVLKEKERPEQNGHVRREARRATGARALR